MDRELRKMLKEKREKGEQKGRAEERAKALADKIDAAKQLLLDGSISLEKIALFAGLPMSTVESLRTELQNNS